MSPKKAGTILFSVVSLFGLFAPQTHAFMPNAARVAGTPEIRLNGLTAYRGLNLHVFFVSARNPVIGAEGAKPHIKQVLAGPVHLAIAADGTAEVPPTVVPQKGFYAFNYLVLAVTDISQEHLFLQNVDGTVPMGASDSAACQPQESVNRAIFFVNVLDLSPANPASNGNSISITLR